MTATLLLAVDTWDLVLDASGNIAVADAPYAMAQDVASAVRLLIGELWYDTGQGIPYLQNIIGQPPSTQFIKAQVEKAALTVPNVVRARCDVASLVNRVLYGTVYVVDAKGVSANVQF